MVQLLKLVVMSNKEIDEEANKGHGVIIVENRDIHEKAVGNSMENLQIGRRNQVMMLGQQELIVLSTISSNRPQNLFLLLRNKWSTCTRCFYPNL